jgi:hypothetical protein
MPTELDLRPGVRDAYQNQPCRHEAPRSGCVDRDVRGWEKASDRAPTWIELPSATRSSTTG